MSKSPLFQRIFCCLAIGVGATAAGVAGCGPDDYNPGPETCDRSEEHNPPVRYTEGTVEGGVYMTSDWDEELLWFPGGMHYTFEHKLGARPRLVQAYLAFDQYGLRDGGHIAFASGNEAEIVRMDDQTLTMRNATCIDFWLLVVASAGENP